MDDAELARKLRRVPSLAPGYIRGVIAFLEVTRENPRKALADELAALDLVAQRTAEAAAAITNLDWDGERGFAAEFSAAGSPTDALRQLAAIGIAAIGARQALELRCKAGRPVSNLSHAVLMLADLIERGGGRADTTQSGELCQAFGVVVEALGLRIENQRETVRAALKRRSAKQ